MQPIGCILGDALVLCNRLVACSDIFCSGLKEQAGTFVVGASEIGCFAERAILQVNSRGLTLI
jgi:hypothetical protein